MFGLSFYLRLSIYIFFTWLAEETIDPLLDFHQEVNLSFENFYNHKTSSKTCNFLTRPRSSDTIILFFSPWIANIIFVSFCILFFFYHLSSIFSYYIWRVWNFFFPIHKAFFMNLRERRPRLAFWSLSITLNTPTNNM